MLRLVPKPRPSLVRRVGEGYAKLLTGLLVIIAGCLVLTIALTLLGI